LRRERSDPQPDEQHRHEDDLRPRVRIERAEQDRGAGQEREQSGAYDQAR
jgi:hypothetical protein